MNHFIPPEALTEEAAVASGRRMALDRSAIAAEFHCNLITPSECERFERDLGRWLDSPDGKLAQWEARLRPRRRTP